MTMHPLVRFSAEETIVECAFIPITLLVDLDVTAVEAHHIPDEVVKHAILQTARDDRQDDSEENGCHADGSPAAVTPHVLPRQSHEPHVSSGFSFCP